MIEAALAVKDLVVSDVIQVTEDSYKYYITTY